MAKKPARKKPERKEPYEVLFRIQRGLAGHVSYLAACEANSTFSEYLLYEPILRILMARGYSGVCEFPCPGMPKAARGDHKKVDFEATKSGLRFALEVKWVKAKTPLTIKGDYDKLVAFRAEDPKALCFLCVFGPLSALEKPMPMAECFIERGDRVVAEFVRTKYGCRIYEVDYALSDKSAPRKRSAAA